MKASVLYTSVACITCILTVLIFLNFQKQWKAAKTFQQTVRSRLSIRHLLIAPELVNVENWQIGDSAVYNLQTNTESKQIAFHVAAQDPKNTNRFWLKTDGLVEINEKGVELWRLLDKTNLRPGFERRGFYFFQEAIPIPLPTIGISPNPIVLEKLGDETLETPIGTLKCEHSFASIRSPDGKLEPLLELWTNPTVRPLGLVRVRWRDASFDLVRIDTKKIPEIPSVLLTEFNRDIPSEGLCTRCHADSIDPIDLKLQSISSLEGKSLNLTTALFHHRLADSIKPEDMISIYLIGKSGQAREQTLAKFSWRNGSFWVKPDPLGWMKLNLDETAQQGNITVEPSTERLTLDIIR